MEDAAHQLGLEVEPVDARVATVRGLLAEGGPVLVAHPGLRSVPSQFLVLLACDRRGAWPRSWALTGVCIVWPRPR